ncbi:MAG: hypothetical protein SCH72_15075, partial [Desulfuromonadales bacterium]|nr:hypothetical protein [Desulfuromonadales bacterium]
FDDGGRKIALFLFWSYFSMFPQLSGLFLFTFLKTRKPGHLKKKPGSVPSFPQAQDRGHRLEGDLHDQRHRVYQHVAAEGDTPPRFHILFDFLQDSPQCQGE